MNFKRGDVFEFCGSKFMVLENYGESGTVQEYPEGDIVRGFRWSFEGATCKLLTRGQY